MESLIATKQLPTPTGYLAYDQVLGTDARLPGVVFLHGFRSDRHGTKAEALYGYCQQRGQSFLKIDLSGHGESTGEFADGSLASWLEDVKLAINQLTHGPQIIIGSSMGGWLGLLLAIQQPHHVAGLIGIAAAPNFTERLFNEHLTPIQQEELVQQGRTFLANVHDPDQPYLISRSLIEDSRQALVPETDIPIYCPVRLLQGMQDIEVPWQTAVDLAANIQSDDCHVRLIKAADHRFSGEQELVILLAALAEMTQN